MNDEIRRQPITKVVDADLKWKCIEMAVQVKTNTGLTPLEIARCFYDWLITPVLNHVTFE